MVIIYITAKDSNGFSYRYEIGRYAIGNNGEINSLPVDN